MGNNKGNVYVWRLQATQAAQLMATKGNSIHAENGSIQESDMMWDLQPVTKIQAHSKYLLRSVLSPDARYVCVPSTDPFSWLMIFDKYRRMATTSADSTIKIWSITNPKPNNGSSSRPGTSSYQFKLEKTLGGHQRWVWDCVFSADSEYLVSASSDHTARLWDLSSGETIRQYQGHHKAAICVALNDVGM